MPSRAPQDSSFGRTFGWVTAAHGAVIVLVLVWAFYRPAPEPPVEFINMVNPGSLVQGQAGVSTAPKPTRKPKAPTPQPVVARVTPKPAPQPQPKPQPVAKVQPKPAPKITPKPIVKPTPQPTPKPVAQAAKPSKPKVKVNLQEVTRTVATQPKPQAKPQPLTDLAERLSDTLQRAGERTAKLTGRSGAANGQENDFGWYYRLIKERMFNAWDAPAHLAGRGLATLVVITVDASGDISRVSMERSSGNADHDATALTAARSVSRLGQPRPDGMPSVVTVNFKLED